MTSRDVADHRCRRVIGKGIAPQAIDQRVGRDRASAVDHERTEDLTRETTADLDLAPAGSHRQRTEHADAERTVSRAVLTRVGVRSSTPVHDRSTTPATCCRARQSSRFSPHGTSLRPRNLTSWSSTRCHSHHDVDRCARQRKSGRRAGRPPDRSTRAEGWCRPPGGRERPARDQPPESSVPVS